MAEPLKYTPRPPKIGPDAHEELEQLLQSAHEHGALRFANDLIAANSEWMQVIVDGLNKQGSRAAVQNLAMLAMVLSTIDPRQLCKVLLASRGAFERMAAHAHYSEGDEGDSPGVTGAYRMLHDEALWHALVPLVEALKAFGKGMNRDVHKPISAFTGRQTRQP